MPEFFSSENTPLPLSKRLSDQFNAKIYPLDYAKTHIFIALPAKRLGIKASDEGFVTDRVRG
jgi:hypothetical protein